MAASISLKGGKLGAKIFKKTKEYLTGAVGDYIQDAMPNTTSTLYEARSEFNNVSSTFKNVSASVRQRASQMSRQAGLKKILDWYTTNGGEDIYDSDNLSFDEPDSDIEDSEISALEISESERNANKISASVIDSNHQLLKGEMEISANISTVIDSQTAVISAGFDDVKKLISNLIEITAKNSAALITATASNGPEDSNSDRMLKDGKFSITGYKDVIMRNIKSNPELGMLMAFMPMLKTGGMTNPQQLISMGIESLIDKKAPNAKNVMKSLDDYINNFLMDSLSRLGERNDLFSIFGVKAKRNEVSGESSSLELKNISYNTISQEYLTKAIPGYLQKILVQLGGPNVVFDARSRSFKTQGAIKQEFDLASANMGNLNRATDRVKETFGNDQYGKMVYDLLMTDLSDKHRYTDGTKSNARSTVESFAKDGEFAKYMANLLKSNGVKVSQKDYQRLFDIGENLKAGTTVNIDRDIMGQLTRTTLNRNSKMNEYINKANMYGVDLEGMKTSVKQDIQTILERNGMVKPQSSVSDKSSKTASLNGQDYTNKALYEIHRLLGRGINVFQVGSIDTQKKPFTKRGYVLAPPANMRRSIDSVQEYNKANSSSIYEDPKFKEVKDKIINSDPVQNAKKAAKEKISSWLGDKNMEFGNVKGYLKHKLMGTGYEYTDENGNHVNVKENQGGGLFGFAKEQLTSTFANAKKGVSNWFSSVKGYFDYGNGNAEDSSVKSKRSKMIATSVGAMAGLGLLGGPLGLIMGGLAGNAIGLNIGDKISSFLFGQKGEDGKRKGGAIRKVTDTIVDPIKYQFLKTTHHLGNILKKNILGPLSDIGVALKDRITSEASSAFSKVFSGIGKLIMAPFKKLGDGLLKFMKVPISAVGTGARAYGSAATGMIGFGLESVANFIASGRTHTEVDPETGEIIETKSTKNLKERRKKRNADIKSEGKFQSYKDWKKDEDIRREERWNKLKNATAEDIEIINNTSEVASNTAEIREGVTTLAELGSERGSIFTHDEGIHERIDRIIEVISGHNPTESSSVSEEAGTTIPGYGNAVPNNATISSSNEDESVNRLAASAIQTAATISTEGNMTTDDQKETAGVMSEVSKDNPSKDSIMNRLKKLMKIQEKDKLEEKEKSTTLWDTIKTIAGSIGSGLGNILQYLPYIATIAGAIGLIKEIISNWSFSETIKHFTDNLGTSIKELILGDDDDKTDTVDEGVNSALALVDAQVDNKWSLANPYANVYHNDRDAAGNKVVDQGKTNAKQNYQIDTPLAQSITQNAVTMSNAYKQSAALTAEADAAQVAAANANKAASQASSLASKGGKYSEKYQEIAESRTKLAGEQTEIANQKTAAANKAVADAKEETSHSGSKIASGITRNVARVGTMSIIGNVAGGFASHVASNMGMNETQADNLGNMATRATVAGLMINQGKSALNGKRSIVDTILDVISKAFDCLSKKFKSFGKLKSFAKNIDNLFDNIYNATVGKMTNALATMIATKMAVAGGKASVEELASALTLGLTIAVAGVAGIISGVCGTEHLFGIMPGKADGTMIAISGFIKGAFEALEAVPGVGLLIAAFDVIDEFIFKNILIDENGMGHTLKSYLASYFYKLLKGEKGAADLSEKQKVLADEKEYYNKTYGSDIDLTTFNDMVNNDGLFDKIWRGGVKTDENGHLKFDAAGGRIDGGIKGWWTGGEKQYAMNEDGTVKRDANGNAIVAKDAYGNTMTVSGKGAGARGWNSFKRFFAGGDIYETDENGQAILDDNGNYIVKDKEKNVFGKIGDVASSAGAVISDFTKSTYEMIVSSTKDFGNYMKGIGGNIVGGDLKALWSEDKGDNANIVMKLGSIFIKCAATVPTAVSWLGHKIKELFEVIPGKVNNSFNALASNQSSITDKVKNGDVSGLMSLTMTEDPENPVGGITNTLFGINKVMNVPIAGVKWIGNKIKDGIKTVSAKIKNSFTTFASNHNTIKSLADSGDVSSLAALIMTEDPENPVGGITNALFNIDKITSIPSAAFHWVGNKIKNGWNSAIDTVKGGFTNLGKNINSIDEKAKKGDISGLTELEFTSDDNNILNGVMSGIFTADKIINYPRTLMHWVGNKIVDALGSTGDAIKSDKNELDASISKLNDYSINGEIGSIWDTKVKWDNNDPLKPIYDAAFTIAKLWNTFAGIIPWIAKKINKPIEDIKDWFADTFDWVSGVGGGSTTHTSTTGVRHGERGKNIGGGIGGAEIPTTTPINNTSQSSNWTKSVNFAPYKDLNSYLEANNIQKPSYLTPNSTYVGSTSFNKDPVSTLYGNPLDREFVVTSKFGPRSGVGTSDFHHGVDLSNSSGIAKVASTFSGEVESVKTDVSDTDTAKKVNGNWTYTGNNSGGNYVVVKSDNGYKAKFLHLKHGTIPNYIKKGAKINAGTFIGEMGSTGWSTGAHLHYELRDSDDKSFDPEPFVTNQPNARLSYESDYMPNNETFEDVSVENDTPTLMGILTTVGNKFLSLISGGLIGEVGSKSNFSTSSLSSSNGYSIVSSTTISSAADFITKIVYPELGNGDNGNNNNKYNTWYYGHSVSGDSYPWCCVFVEWCFDKAGLALPIKTASSKSLYDYYVNNEPSKVFKNNPKPGDIFIVLYSDETRKGHGHTGIVKSSSGNGFTTIEGNFNNNKVTSRSTSTTSLKDFVCFIRPVDFEALENFGTSTQLSDSPTSDMMSLWNYFRSKGYSEEATAGILGCWQAESSGKSKSIEWDYSDTFKEYGGYDMINNREKMDSYTKKLHQHYASNGNKASIERYKASDGHYYPGLGAAQWTGPRGKDLLDFARNNGLDWSRQDTQLKYMEYELSNGYSKTGNELKSMRDVNAAAQLFMTNYEGNEVDQKYADGVTYLSKRQSYANQIYNKYAGTDYSAKTNGGASSNHSAVMTNNNRNFTMTRIGGDNIPTTKTSTIRQSTYVSKPATSVATKKQYEFTNTMPTVVKSSPSIVPPTNQESSGNDLTKVAALVTRAVEELIKITNNTGSSTSYLEAINDKDFVDQGLRDSINALKDVKMPQHSNPLPRSQSTVAMNLAQP